MAQKDKIKWDNKYKELPKLLEKRDPCEKLVKFIDKVSKGKALDVACGSGRNSIYMANNGFEVDALDISSVALENLNKLNNKDINTLLVDLDEYNFPENTYNLIIKTNFLDRDIIQKLKKSLKKDGIIVIETYMEDEENEKKHSNPDYLLKKDELKSFFTDGFEILDYDEFFNETYELYRMKKQSIVVKKLG
ncbi:methyltransferase domain-containing protein [Campylobacterota bacterium DY0563]